MDFEFHSERHFGDFGGQYVPETLMKALEELEEAYETYLDDEDFMSEYRSLLSEYSGRPTPLTPAERFSEEVGTEVWLKRDDLNHTGAHKLNNTLGQILLADRMGKDRIIAETGAGQHGVATATVCAYFDKECVVYMGEEDIERQSLNVFRMKLLGAEIEPVTSGGATLKDATNEAIRDWVTNVENTHYIIGSVVGPHPYPAMVRDFQSVIGKEAREQFNEKAGGRPDALVACIGGGSNAMGLFSAFLDSDEVDLHGVEAGGQGLETDQHAAPLVEGDRGVLHGSMSFLMSDEDGQVESPYSISAGLDYPGVGPQLAHLKESGQLDVRASTDETAVEGFHKMSEFEGIIPALEPSHAVGYLLEHPEWIDRHERIILNMCGRGDKDVRTVADHEGREL
jgi:tryptophan synthase beta chain